jgi:hypothetical protein
MPTPRRWMLPVALSSAATLGGLALWPAQQSTPAATHLEIPPDGPLIQPERQATRCLNLARIIIGKWYGVRGDSNRFTGAQRVDVQTWRVTGELRSYRPGTVRVYPYECLDSPDSTSVNIHPRP